LVASTARAESAAAKPPAPAEVDARTRDARARWEEGIRAFDREDFESARVSFEQAYAVMHIDSVLKNLAIAQLRSKHVLEGARNLAEYLRSAKGVADKDHAAVQKLLTDAERELGRLAVETDVTDANIVIDGETVGRSPLGFDWYVSPGSHLISVSKAGYKTEEQSALVEAGQRKASSIRLLAPTAPAGVEASSGAATSPASPGTDPPNSRGIETRTVVLVAGAAVTIVAASGALFFGLKSSSANSDAMSALAQARAQFGNDPCSSAAGSHSAACAQVHSKLDDRTSASHWATASLAVAGVSALTTGALFFLWPQREADSNAGALRLLPAVQQGSAAVVLTGQF